MPRRGRPKKAFPPPPKTLPDGRVRIWWNGTWHLLGRVDDEAAWRAEYARLIALWSTDPGAAPLRADEYLVSTLCRDYLASNDCPPEGAQRERVGTAIDLLLELFGHVAAASFGPASLDAWQSWLCGLPASGLPRGRLTGRSPRSPPPGGRPEAVHRGSGGSEMAGRVPCRTQGVRFASLHAAGGSFVWEPDARRAPGARNRIRGRLRCLRRRVDVCCGSGRPGRCLG